MDSLVRALTWDRTCFALAAEWKEGYTRLLRERFVTFAQADPSGLLERAAEVMNGGELEMLLLSPRVSWRLLRDMEPDTVSELQADMLRALDEDADNSDGANEKNLETGSNRKWLWLLAVAVLVTVV